MNQTKQHIYKYPKIPFIIHNLLVQGGKLTLKYTFNNNTEVIICQEIVEDQEH